MGQDINMYQYHALWHLKASATSEKNHFSKQSALHQKVRQLQTNKANKLPASPRICFSPGIICASII